MMKMLEESEKVLDAMLPDERAVAVENAFGYIYAKAYKFNKAGADVYRKDDFFEQPPADTEPEMLELIASGCRQILSGKGFSAEKPLQDIGVAGFYRLMELFHFESSKRKSIYKKADGGRSGGIIDRITFVHLVDGREATLYNFCANNGDD